MRQRQSSVTTETQYPVRSIGAEAFADFACAIRLGKDNTTAAIKSFIFIFSP